MPRIASCKTVFRLRRAYTVAAGDVKAKSEAAAASMIRKAIDPSNLDEGAKGVEKEVFWMRDPKTGNWIPETHFNDVDAAELRALFLSKKA